MITKFTPEQFQRLYRWGGTGVLFVLIMWSLSFFYLLGFNTNFSLPGYVYLVVRYHHPVKDGLAAFHPPPNDFYSKIWFIKRVKGIPGDVVTWNGRQFFINNEPLGTAKIRAENGIALAVGAEGVIPDHEYFMWTEHPDSFDSRYAQISLVKRDRIIGRAYRVL